MLIEKTRLTVKNLRFSTLAFVADVGQNIRVLRLMRGLSLEGMAGDLGITRESLSRIELGKTDLNYSRLAQIAGYFGLKPSELLEFDAEAFMPVTKVRKSGPAPLTAEELRAQLELTQRQLDECRDRLRDKERLLVIYEDRLTQKK